MTGLDLQVRNSMEFVSSSAEAVPAIEDTTTARLSCYAGLPDDAVIEGVYDGTFEPAPNHIMVSGREDMAHVMHELGRQANVTIPDEYIAGSYLHERHHEFALRGLGVSVVRFGVALLGTEPFNMQAFHVGERPTRPIAKLGLAAIFGIPLIPSEGDEAIVRSLGYKNIPNLAARVMSHNSRAKGNFIPAPFSC